MSEKTTGERPPGTPSQRALGAMESAVRRARERTGVVTRSGPFGAGHPTRLDHPVPGGSADSAIATVVGTATTLDRAAERPRTL